MDIKILNAQNQETDDTITLRCKILNGAKIEDIKQDLETMCLMGYDNALVLWYYLFGAGENLKIDEIVDAFEFIEPEQALENINDIPHDKQNTPEDDIDNQLLASVKALIKNIKAEPKQEFKNKKELFKLITENVDWFGERKNYSEELKKLISKKEVSAEELFEIIARFIHQDVNFSLEAKEIVKLLANRNYSNAFYEFLKNNENELEKN